MKKNPFHLILPSVQRRESGRAFLPAERRRRGFTLIELLVVIAIGSLWWEAACMDPAVVRSSSFPTYEGVEPKRHLGQAVISFNDGHSEARKSTMINPPANPADGSAKALINSQYWDPLQRGGNQ